MASASTMDAYEPDDTLAQARPIEIDGAPQQHTFHIEGDNDWVVLNAQSGTTYTIETFNLGTTTDTVLGLYDASQTLLESNDDGGEGLASRIVWTAPSSAPYYVQVQPYGFGGGQDDSYELSVATGVQLRHDQQAAADIPVRIEPGQAESADAFILTDVQTQGVPRQGETFTTIIYAQGSADGYKLLTGAKSDYLELVSVQPLTPEGTAWNTEAVNGWEPGRTYEDGPVSLTFSGQWESESSAPLVALGWQVVNDGGARLSTELPLRLFGRDSNGQASYAGQARVTVLADAEMKIETINPSTIVLTEASILTIGASGLSDLPKVYLVEDTTRTELTNVDFAPTVAPGDMNVLIAEVPTTIKAGVYKVMLQDMEGNTAVSEQDIRLLAESANQMVYLPLVQR
jgi:hypothetical protein